MGKPRRTLIFEHFDVETFSVLSGTALRRGGSESRGLDHAWINLDRITCTSRSAAISLISVIFGKCSAMSMNLKLIHKKLAQMVRNGQFSRHSYSASLGTALCADCKKLPAGTRPNNSKETENTGKNCLCFIASTILQVCYRQILSS